MKRHRELFGAQVAEIREELLRLGACLQVSPANLSTSVSSEHVVTPTDLMATAYELAGYAVATLALGRALRPASENLQGTKPREVASGRAAALWGFELD